MSAIFGILNLNGVPVEDEQLERMSAALTCHGVPAGRWVHGPVGLGQRLMCFTPQDVFERQPLVSADRCRVLVSDARLDNRQELSALLSGLPETAGDTIPDSALILRAYETWGVECGQHLVGVFAFAVWDARSHTLFAARSPIIAPALVYFSSPQVLAFASMPVGLHALSFIPRRLNEQALADLLAGVVGQPHATLYTAVQLLPCGHWLQVGDSGVQIACYWRPDLQHELRLESDAAYWQAFTDLFERVVDDQLCSLTPVALQMSGGLDSSAVAAVAAPRLARQGARLAAFTEVPRPGFSEVPLPGVYADETPFVQAIAGLYPNLDLKLIRTDGQIFLDDLDGLFTHLEMPFQNSANRVWIEAILRAAAQDGRRVLLDGMQGNLTLSWNGNGLIPALARRGEWAQAWHQVRALAPDLSAGAALRIFISRGLLPWLPNSLWQAANRLRHPLAPPSRSWLNATVIHPDFAAAWRVGERARTQHYSVCLRPTGDLRRWRYEMLARQDFGLYLSAYRALYGVDMRTPTADVRLAEFCLALPEEQYLRDGEARRLVRRAMVGRLPDCVLSNRRRGLQAADWFERLSAARPRLAAELERLERSPLARRVLDLGRMRRMFERWPAEGSDYATLAGYQTILGYGLMMGRFLCWFEG